MKESRLHKCKSTYDIGIASVGFGPGFLENRHPYFIFVGLAEYGLTLAVDRYVVINNNFFDNSVDAEEHSIYRIFCSLLNSKNCLNPFLLFSDGWNSGQEVAVSKGTLNGILWLYFPIEKDGIGNDMGKSFPLFGFNSFDSSKAMFVVLKLGVFPEVITFLV